jgi:hypothetical protein
MENTVVLAIKIKHCILFAAVVIFPYGELSAAVVAGDSLKPGPVEKKPAPAEAAAKKSNVKQIVFEEQKIEGKIRRPQLVLIKADQRPDFAPMIMQAAGKSKSITGLIDENLINGNANNGPFMFEGTKVQYAKP